MPPRVLRFGVFELDCTAGELRKQGRLVALPQQPMRVLELLASKAEQVVTRQELQSAIWGDDTQVDFEAGLSTCINQVRAALGDRAAAPRFVETLPKRGYRFLAPVELVPAAGTLEPAAEGSDSQDVEARRRGWTLRTSLGASIAVSLVALGWVLASARPEPVPVQPVPVVVLPVRLDHTLAELEPLASSLTDALIGALTMEGGPLLRVASPMAVRHLREGEMTFEDIRALGPECFVTVKLWPVGDQINVHVKVTAISGWMLWSTDRLFPTPKALAARQMDLSSDLSREVLREIKALWRKADVAAR